MSKTRHIADVMIEAADREEHIVEMVQRVCEEHGVFGSTKVTGVEKIEIEFDSLPQLPFYFSLAAEFLVPIEDIKVEDDYLGEGCETCGYGGGTKYTVTIQLGAEE